MDNSAVLQFVELAKHLTAAKAELNTLGRLEKNIFAFSETQEELDEVIKSMADATNRILDSVERIEKFDKRVILHNYSKTIHGLITQVYENCSFQDLSGQRIQKVSRMLKDVEKSLNQIFSQYDVGGSTQSAITAEKVKQIFYMKNMLEKLKSELLQTNSSKIESKLLSNSFNELEEVITSAEKATNFILNSAEGMQAICNKVMGSDKKEFQGYINEIFETCSFQDLISQRVRKVLKTFDQINKIILKLYKFVQSDELFKGLAEEQIIDDANNLLNGPQLPQKALKQDVIDALMDIDKKK